MKNRKSTNQKIREQNVVELLQNIGNKQPLVRATALEALCETDYPYTFQEVVQALSDKNLSVKITATACLGILDDKRGIAPLLGQLTNRNIEVRLRAIEALGFLLKGGKSPQSLIERLNDVNELVRAEVALSLGQIGDPKAKAALWAAINDKSPLVRSYVAEAIGKIGNKKDISRLEDFLISEKSELVKIGTFMGLYWIGKRDLTQRMLPLLSSNNYRVRCAVVNSLSHMKMDKPDTEVIIHAFREALKKEPTQAVKSSIKTALQTLRENISSSKW